MSKYYWEKRDSAVAYLDTAERLADRLQTSCANVNHKKYTFYGLQDISRLSSQLVLVCSEINRNYPNTKALAEKRVERVAKAQAILDTLSILFGGFARKIQFKDGVLEEVSELMEKEDSLLVGLSRSASRQLKEFG